MRDSLARLRSIPELGIFSNKTASSYFSTVTEFAMTKRLFAFCTWIVAPAR